MLTGVRHGSTAGWRCKTGGPRALRSEGLFGASRLSDWDLESERPP